MTTAARAASHPDFHRRFRSSTGSTAAAAAGRGLSPPVRTYTDPGARIVASLVPAEGSVPFRFMQRPDPVRAVVFDFDGLLADTEKPWGVAEEAMFTSRGVPYGDTERGLFLGTAVTDTAAIMARYFDEPHPEVLADLLRRAQAELALNSQPMDGAVALLGRVRVPFAVASNTPRDLLDLSMRASGLAELVSVSVSASEVRSPQAGARPVPARLRATRRAASRCRRHRGFPDRCHRGPGCRTMGGDDPVRRVRTR